MRAKTLAETTAVVARWLRWCPSRAPVHPTTRANRCGSLRAGEPHHLLDGAYADQYANGRHVLVDRGGPRKFSRRLDFEFARPLRIPRGVRVLRGATTSEPGIQDILGT